MATAICIMFLDRRAVHEEVIKLDQDFGTSFSGMLVDDAGRMRALWGSYAEQADREEREWCAGLPTAVFEPWVRQLLPLDERQTVAPLPVRCEHHPRALPSALKYCAVCIALTTYDRLGRGSCCKRRIRRHPAQWKETSKPAVNPQP